MKQYSVSELNPHQIEQAIAQCQQHIADNSPSAEMQANLGSLYLRQKRWHKAKNCYQKAIDIEPEFAVAHRGLAEAWTRLQKPYRAADSLNLAFKFDPDCATAQQHHKLAKTLQKQNKPARAIAAYQRAINVSPDFLAAYRNLAKFLLERGEAERAVTLYRQGVERNPKNAEFHLGLGQTLGELEKWQEAIASYQIAIKLDPQLPELYYLWGKALAELEKAELAEKFYKRAIFLKPDYWQAYWQLGILWHQQKNWEFTLAAYRKVRSLQPHKVYVLNRMAAVYRQLNKFDLAIACHREAVKVAKVDSKEENRAIAAYQKTLTNHPQISLQHYYQQAKLLRSKGRFVEAVAAYQQTIQLDPQFKLPYIDLQYTTVAKDKLDELIDFYRGIVEEHPEIAIAWGNLGDALSRQNRIAEAVECYRTASYQQTIQITPDLAQLDWQESKKSGPDFIIAGASKGGTSSLYNYLGHHPQILLPHKKEIDFYWKHFDRGIDWYLAHFPSISDREDLLAGEATPNYLRFPEVARRIQNTFPQTKIIILLRNPADRAISWHYHKFNTGLTNQTLKEEIDLEIARLKNISEAEITKTSFHNPDNILSSLYLFKIQPWIEILGREQFLILKSEDFYQTPAQKMAEVYEFLSLPNHTLPEYPKVNAGSYSEVDAELRKTLVEYFAPYNQKLEEYLDLKFDWQ